jgi:hypothetical protein
MRAALLGKFRMFTATVVLIGLACAVFGIWRRVQWKRMRHAYRSWPSVEGVVETASLRTIQRLDDNDREYDVWAPQVSYRYAVRDGEHRGANAFWFEHAFTHREEADRWLAGVPAGAAVPVFHDPARPARSALALNDPDSAPGSALVWLGLALTVGAFLGPAMQ